MSPLLIDSSVWIALFRGGATEIRERLASAATQGARLATCEPVSLELLAGATERSLPRLERLVDGLAVLDSDPHVDFRTAAALSRASRAQGRTVRSLMDCLIAAVAIRHDAVLVHRDRDFDALAAVSSLRAERWE
ncbi:MAG: PIN domain-containing protein [Candidatus Nanopelagicales bacterium]